MGKTYRYNPEGGCESRPSWKRSEDTASLGEMWPKDGAPARPKRKRAKKATGGFGSVTPEQAMDMMRDRIATVLSTLIHRRILPPHEKDDYTQILNIHICRMLPFFEPGRKGWKDQIASLLRYLNVVVDHAVANIVKHCMTRKRCILKNAMPVEEACEDEEEDDENEGQAILPYSNNPFRDPHGYMEELWLRMDVETLLGMLTEEERIALEMRIQGYTYPEIADETNYRLHLGVDRFHVMNVTMDGIRKAARKCGFEPPLGFPGAGGENSKK